jgi:OmpA-OmpF porin, OOP family
MQTVRRLLVRATLVLSTLFAANVADAQSTAEGFALNRFEPSERGGDWFTSESLDFRGRGRFAAGLVVDYSRHPLVLYSAGGDEVATVVGDQLVTHVGGAVVLWDRVRFGLNLPVAVFQDGQGGATPTNRFSLGSNTAVGDVRIGAGVLIVGAYRRPASLAFDVQLHAPTGSRDAYTSDGAVRATPRLLFAGEVSGFVYAARAGMLFRANSDAFGGSPTGSEATFALAAGTRIDDGKIVLGPELFGSTVVTNGDAFFAKTTTPLELLFGGHYMPTKSIRIGIGAGGGLTRAFGTPQFRVVGAFEWQQPIEEAPPPPPSDRDRDGIVDTEDACPDEAGVRTDDPKTNGCPPPKDRDSDGIIDPEDACPDVAGPKSDDPRKNGCPLPKDRDGDGIIDPDDACPDEPGVKTDDPKTNGCPPPKDRDGDGIIDPEDACPDAAGPKNDDPKKNGCPVAHVEKGQIVIREQVQFAYNSAEILKASDFILEAVQKILEENPEIAKVEVQGHTDNKGGDAYNKKLSERRAASVVKWLVKHKVDKKRLTSVGFGKEKPLDTNDTEEGRTNNRRVEFHIMDQTGAAPAPSAAPPDVKK